VTFPSWLPHADGDVVALGPRGPRGGRTCAALRRDVGALAARLPPTSTGERAIACQGRYAAAVAVLACWERGEVAVLPLNHTPDVLARLHATIPLLHDGGVPAGLDVRDALDRDAAPARLARPDDLAPVVRLSTSGSTGGVRLHTKTAGQLLGEVDVLGPTFGVGPGDVVLGTIPPHHVYGLLFTVLLPLRHGGALVDEAPLFPEAVAAAVRAHGATVVVTVPAHLRALAEGPVDTFRGVRTLFSSGAPLPASTAARLVARQGLHATEVFGSTETGGIAWRRQLEDDRWRPLPGVRVAAEADGRLRLDSPFLEPAEPRPRPCDDRVEVLGDGRFRLLGRLDDVVKIASRRVPLGAVEHALLTLSGVLDAAVVAVDDPTGRQRLEALVVADGLDATAIRGALARELDAVAVPRVHLVDRLPREANGKLPRARLLDALAAARGEGPERTTTVTVPEDHPALAGHFPGDPLLPGVAQLVDLVLPAVRRAWPALGPLVGARRVRFLAPLRPGDVRTLRLERTGDEVRIAIREGADAHTTGVLVFGRSDDASR
jgi:4-coumarate--CoA ligase (photoactive yellow protein activation family)